MQVLYLDLAGVEIERYLGRRSLHRRAVYIFLCLQVLREMNFGLWFLIAGSIREVPWM